MSNEVLRLQDTTTTTPVVLVTGDGRFEVSVRDVQRWIAPNAPDHEAFKHLMVCRAYGVNPLVGEAHLVNQGGEWTTIVDKSGWLRKAQSHPLYDGHEAGLIARPWNAATKQFTGPTIEIEGSFLPPDHLLVGGWARVYVRGKRPTYINVSAAEYNKGQSTWKAIPCTMLRKVALVQALRESGLTTSGWYAAGEVAEPDPRLPAMPVEQIPTEIEVEYAAIEDASCPPDLLAEIERCREALGIPADSSVWRDALAKRGATHVAQLDPFEAASFARKLQALVTTETDVDLVNLPPWNRKPSETADAAPPTNVTTEPNPEPKLAQESEPETGESNV